MSSEIVAIVLVAATGACGVERAGQERRRPARHPRRRQRIQVPALHPARAGAAAPGARRAGRTWRLPTILHIGYYTFLISAYRHGDLSKVYPLARGLSPLLVAAGAFALAGERLSPIALAGVAVACAGIASVSFGGAAAHTRGDRSDCGATDHGSAPGHDTKPGRDDRDRAGPRTGAGGGAAPACGDRERTQPVANAGDDMTQAHDDRRGIVFAAGTALFIAAYTVTDAMGARLSGHAVSYVAWLAILDGLPMLIAAAVLRRAALAHHLAARAWKSAAGGALQLAAYGLVVWALVLAPMAAVSALRETSVLFATIIGVKLLGEPLGTRRITAAALVAVGLMMIEWG